MYRMYRTELRILPALPDDHLTLCALTPRLAALDYRTGHITQELVRDIEEYLRHIGHSGIMTLDMSRVGEPPDFHLWYERINPELMPLTLFAPRIRADEHIWRVRADHMSAELCAELNEYMIPDVIGGFRYISRIGETSEPATLDMFERLAERELAHA